MNGAEKLVHNRRGRRWRRSFHLPKWKYEKIVGVLLSFTGVKIR